jgi:hypothetical protein
VSGLDLDFDRAAGCPFCGSAQIKRHRISGKAQVILGGDDCQTGDGTQRYAADESLRKVCPLHIANRQYFGACRWQHFVMDSAIDITAVLMTLTCPP